MTCSEEYILYKIIKSYTNQIKTKNNETESINKIKQAIKFIKTKRKDISR